MPKMIDRKVSVYVCIYLHPCILTQSLTFGAPFSKLFMTSTFISITGQRLELGPKAENQGKFAGTSGKAIGSRLTSAPGQCLPISSFERLNQLGEGSEF